jgi:saccharopine dehydrogenase-like NADP-dependent oxidoreductase
MTTPRRSITILGAGHIGFAMALLLSRSGDYEVLVADRDPLRLHAVAALGVATCTTGDDAELQRAIEGRFAVLNALPFHCAVGVATLCARAGVHYFDLTEDVPSTQAIRALAQGARSVLMPQCGLAPGFIGIVGNDLARRFDELHSLRMRVGALPRYPQGALRYNLTWSTEGLINEYCNPCEAIVDGAKTTVAALDGLETFALDGVEYEAFNTSGGLGTLTETLAGRARQVDYKSIRYPGHCAILKLLLNDLRLRERRDLLKEIFEAAIPTTEQDVIVVFASSTGVQGGRLVQESHSSRILGCEVDGHRLSAIQRTTAAGICAALDLVAQGKLPQQGFVGQEQVALADFLANRFGSVYATQPETCAEACAV